MLGALGAVFAGDVRQATELVHGHADLARTSGDGYVRAHFGIVDGQLALIAGDLDQAEGRLRETVSMARELGNPFTLAVTLNVMATVSELRADHATSALLLGEATELSTDASMSWSLAYSLPALDAVAVRVGDIATGAPRRERTLLSP